MIDHVLCPFADITDGEARRFDVVGHRIALVRIGDDVYAIGDRCSHADVSLAGGEVDTRTCELECPKHGSTFDLKTGTPTAMPAVRPVPVYDVKVVDDDVVLTIAEESE